MAEDAADFLLGYVVSFTSDKKNRDLCEPFKLKTIVKSSVLAPKKGQILCFVDVLKFQKSVGQDAESVDMNGSSDLEELWIQIQVVLQPGDAVFDATLKYKVEERRFSVEVIIRNMEYVIFAVYVGVQQREQDQLVQGPGGLHGGHQHQAMVLL